MELNKSKENIGLLFDEIAPRYDFLNHFFTANLDKKWRRQIVRFIKSGKIKSNVILDLASGTGDMINELLILNPEKAYAFDISAKMLEILKNKIKHPGLFVELADSENLPLDSGTVDLVTIGFGIRNFENLEASMSEILRVLKKGGMLIVLEMFNFEKRNRFFEFYFTKIMPVVGKIVSGSESAYSYLHSSVMNFRTVEEFSEKAEKTGFSVFCRKNNFLNFVYTVYLTK
jgi:demethylmenaquinone methyltransferase / 2-methoxy-6-polyprenyl-1,4-benzoquinol methylase